MNQVGFIDMMKWTCKFFQVNLVKIFIVPMGYNNPGVWREFRGKLKMSHV